jgi:hypothetical protein
MRMVNKKYKLVVFNMDGDYVAPEKFVSSSIDGIVDKLARLNKTLWSVYPLHAIVEILTNTIVDLTDDCLQDILLEDNVRTVDDYSKWLKENSRIFPQVTIL